MRLQVQVYTAHAAPTAQADCSFLEIASPTLSLEDLSISICKRYSRLYPHRVDLQIHKLQDSDCNDLDLAYTVSDVFSDKSTSKNDSIVRVIRASTLRESSIPPESALRSRSWRKQRGSSLRLPNLAALPEYPLSERSSKRQKFQGISVVDDSLDEREADMGKERWLGGDDGDLESLSGEARDDNHEEEHQFQRVFSLELGESMPVLTSVGMRHSETTDVEITGSSQLSVGHRNGFLSAQVKDEQSSPTYRRTPEAGSQFPPPPQRPVSTSVESALGRGSTRPRYLPSPVSKWAPLQTVSDSGSVAKRVSVATGSRGNGVCDLPSTDEDDPTPRQLNKFSWTRGIEGASLEVNNVPPSASAQREIELSRSSQDEVIHGDSQLRKTVAQEEESCIEREQGEQEAAAKEAKHRAAKAAEDRGRSLREQREKAEMDRLAKEEEERQAKEKEERGPAERKREKGEEEEEKEEEGKEKQRQVRAAKEAEERAREQNAKDAKEAETAQEEKKAEEKEQKKTQKAEEARQKRKILQEQKAQEAQEAKLQREKEKEERARTAKKQRERKAAEKARERAREQEEKKDREKKEAEQKEQEELAKQEVSKNAKPEIVRTNKRAIRGSTVSADGKTPQAVNGSNKKLRTQSPPGRVGQAKATLPVEQDMGPPPVPNSATRRSSLKRDSSSQESTGKMHSVSFADGAITGSSAHSMICTPTHAARPPPAKQTPIICPINPKAATRASITPIRPPNFAKGGTSPAEMKPQESKKEKEPVSETGTGSETESGSGSGSDSESESDSEFEDEGAPGIKQATASKVISQASKTAKSTGNVGSKAASGTPKRNPSPPLVNATGKLNNVNSDVEMDDAPPVDASPKSLPTTSKPSTAVKHTGQVVSSDSRSEVSGEDKNALPASKQGLNPGLPQQSMKPSNLIHPAKKTAAPEEDETEPEAEDESVKETPQNYMNRLYKTPKAPVSSKTTTTTISKSRTRSATSPVSPKAVYRLSGLDRLEGGDFDVRDMHQPSSQQAPPASQSNRTRLQLKKATKNDPKSSANKDEDSDTESESESESSDSDSDSDGDSSGESSGKAKAKSEILEHKKAGPTKKKAGGPLGISDRSMMWKRT